MVAASKQKKSCPIKTLMWECVIYWHPDSGLWVASCDDYTVSGTGDSPGSAVWSLFEEAERNDER